MKLNL